MAAKQRRRILIEPNFQVRLVLRVAAWVVFATLLTGLLTWLSLDYQDRILSGDLFRVFPEGGPGPQLLTRARIVLPTVVLALVVNLSLVVAFMVAYSRRLAGPIHKLRTALDRLSDGKRPARPFRLRRGDEFHDLAASFDRFLENRPSKQ